MATTAATCRCCISFGMGSQSTMPPPAMAWTSLTHRFSTRSSQRKDKSRCVSFGCSVSIACTRDSVHVIKSAALDVSPAFAHPVSDVVLGQNCQALVQAVNLRAKLEKLAKLEHAVWVTSPLTRAVETFLLSCPKRHLLAPKISQIPTGSDMQVRGPLSVLSSGASAGHGRATCCR